jgi:4'-phosphopantetheinyl transferase
VVGGEGSVEVEVWLVGTAATTSRPRGLAGAVVPGAVAPDAASPAAVLAGAVLSDDERDRASRFRRPSDRHAYVAAHTALRVLVGARLGLPPHAVRFGREPCPLCGGPHGRPTVVGGGLHVSLSRTAGVAAVALSPAVVGVDVESTGRAVTLDDLVVALPPAELPAADRDAALRRWVRKEAYLKGLGTGLGLDPATVDLSADPPGWQVLDVPTAPGLMGAVAVRSPAPAAVTVTEVGLHDLVGDVSPAAARR